MTDENMGAEILIPGILLKNGRINKNSIDSISGVVENDCNHLNKGDVVQFERFGFVKLERTKDKITGILAHK